LLKVEAFKLAAIAYICYKQYCRQGQNSKAKARTHKAEAARPRPIKA